MQERYLVGNDLNSMKNELNNILRDLFHHLKHKIVMTEDGGIGYYAINKTGSRSVKGTLISASNSTDNAFKLANEYDAMGIVYEGGIGDGKECLIVFTGRAKVLLIDAHPTTTGQLALSSPTAGRATTIANPGGGLPGADTHFKEIGHVMETVAGGTNKLCLVNLHFN